eukprot:6204742-Amphidinium_carterae.4
MAQALSGLNIYICHVHAVSLGEVKPNPMGDVHDKAPRQGSAWVDGSRRCGRAGESDPYMKPAPW